MTTSFPTTFPANGPIAVHITQRSGDVVLTAAETEEIHVDVRAANNRTESADLVTTTTVEQGTGMLTITVPRSSVLGISSGAVDIEVTVPIHSDAVIESGSGDLELHGEFSDVSITTGSGDLTAERMGEGRLNAGSGTLRVREVGDVWAKTGSGDVRIDRASGTVTVGTGSGDVHLGEAGATNTISVASGDITVGEVAGQLELKSASGDIGVHRAVEGELRARTASGDLIVGVADGTAAKLDCSSIAGRIRSDLDPANEPGEADRQLLVSSSSASGSVTIRRA